jgi:hypothetical protein
MLVRPQRPVFWARNNRYSLIQSKGVDGLWIAHLGWALARRTTTTESKTGGKFKITYTEWSSSSRWAASEGFTCRALLGRVARQHVANLIELTLGRDSTQHLWHRQIAEQHAVGGDPWVFSYPAPLVFTGRIVCWCVSPYPVKYWLCSRAGTLSPEVREDLKERELLGTFMPHRPTLKQ